MRILRRSANASIIGDDPPRGIPNDSFHIIGGGVTLLNSIHMQIVPRN